ncbi:MAG: Ig-like domain-containing protein [Bacteroidales bacterium]|nr:Ig-like domain-containing protein [Bacteroidales bacterium]
MKKVYSFFLAAIALVAFSSCEQQDQVIDNPADGFNGTIVFSSAKPEIKDDNATKTAWTGSSVQWTKGDKIRVGFTLDGVWQSSGKTLDNGNLDSTPRFYLSNELGEDAEIASFSVPIGDQYFQESLKDLTGEMVFYGVYPSNFQAGQSNAPDISINVPASQKPSANTFDASADIMVGQTEALTAFPTEPVLMNWTRVVALADITLKNLSVPEGENLVRLTLTAQEGADLVGSHTLNVEDKVVADPDGQTNEIVLNVSELAISSDNTLEVWAGLLPETITSLTVVLETDAATYTREITGISKTFKQNKRNILGIKMEDAVRAAKEEELWVKKSITSIKSSDVFVIVGNNGENYALSNDKSTNAAPEAVKVSVSGNALTANPTDNIKWTLESTSTGYIFHPNGDDSKWLYCTNTNNGVRVGTNEANLFVLDADSGYLKHVGTSRFLGIYATTPDWRCYTSSTATNIKDQTFSFYVKSTGDEPVLNPVTIAFNDPTTTVNVGETVTNVATVDPEGLEVTYSSSDATVATVDATGKVTGVAAGIVDITASFAGNDEYEAASATYSITVNAAGEYAFTTIAELNALATDDDQSVTGTLTDAIVSFVPDAKNAIIKDATGSTLIYKEGHGLKQGQTFSGTTTVTVVTYHNAAELKAIDAEFVGTETSVEPQTMTLAELVGKLSTYQSAYVKVEDLTVTAVNGQNISVENGGKSYVVFAPASHSCVAGDVITVVGTITWYGNNDQIKVWSVDDLTITQHTADTHTISFTQPTVGGTFTVKVNGTAVSDGDEYMEGTVVTLTATAAEGYTFTGWTVTGATVSGNTETATFTVGTEDVTIAASFKSNSSTSKTEEIAGTFTSTNSNLSLTTESGITIVQAKGTGTNAVNANYNTASTLRMYKGHTLTFSGKTITRIEITVNGTYYGNSLSADCGTLTPTSTSGGVIVWEGSSESVTITNVASASNVQLRPSKIVVTYE